ncbi:MAG: hypothetical protein IPJ01_11525 [Micavibrio sp.]|nr:hypothetical protein [Micavibrio sp.]
MSIISGNGALIGYDESDLECPICNSIFDASEKMSKAKYPTFKTKCPICKGIIGITIPIFGGNTKCFEWNIPKIIEHTRLKTEAPFKVNGKVVIKKTYDDNSDEPSDILV